MTWPEVREKTMPGPGNLDVLTVLANVHGGSYHKIISLHQGLAARGLRSLVLIGTDPTRGLQLGIDVSPQDVDSLAGLGVLVLSRRDIRAVLEDTPARLCLFDAYRDIEVPDMIRLVRERHGAKTAQLGGLLMDFSYSGADFCIMQHPLTLWFEVEYSRSRSSRLLPAAKGIFFAGNIFYEPLPNVWTTRVSDRASFFAKYGLDPDRPLVLWLPDRLDALDLSFGKIVEAVRAAGLNLGLKMHPWEYKFYGHGFDPENKGCTSAERWGLRAIEEKDTSWAYKFCDLAVMRGSSVGMELALWHRPGLYLPSGSRFRRLDAIQTDIVSTCSLRLGSADELGPFLEQGLEGADFSEADYEAVRSKIYANPDRDSFEQHLDCLQGLLDLPQDLPALGSMAAVRRLYRGRVPFSYVGKAKLPAHLLARLRGQSGSASASLPGRSCPGS
ncbi:MAG: hypothetical protein JW718_03010 [Desulfovibrionaceae bacterium]|nr:hypothetical protein [Desulfovibrionaceae bacterium]